MIIYIYLKTFLFHSYYSFSSLFLFVITNPELVLTLFQIAPCCFLPDFLLNSLSLLSHFSFDKVSCPKSPFYQFIIIFKEVFMSRNARQLSSTDTYHVVIRGADHQLLFEEKKDYQKYLEILQLYEAECQFELYAYCLMPNHIHLLIH